MRKNKYDDKFYAKYKIRKISDAKYDDRTVDNSKKTPLGENYL